MANEFLPFCKTFTGTNLPTQSAYAADPNRDIGAQPGIASSKLNNKPLRQATFVASQLAQYIATLMNVDTLDDGIPSNFLSQITAALMPIAPIYSKFLSGTGSYSLPYYFFIVAGNATIGATYTNNIQTFTVTATVTGGTVLTATGTGAPAAAGTLSRASGTGDATLMFLAVRAPLYLKVRAVGGGGGGGGSGSAGGSNGGNGGATTFGPMTAGNGMGGVVGAGSTGSGGGGGTPTLGAGPVGIIAVGSAGSEGSGSAITTFSTGGGLGGSAPFFSGAGASAHGVSAGAGVTNSGGGGAGGGDSSGGSAINSGGGGGSGGFIDAIIFAPVLALSYGVGAGGTAGSAGTSGFVGAAGGSGFIDVIAMFQ